MQFDNEKTNEHWTLGISLYNQNNNINCNIHFRWKKPPENSLRSCIKSLYRKLFLCMSFLNKFKNMRYLWLMFFGVSNPLFYFVYYLYIEFD